MKRPKIFYGWWIIAVQLFRTMLTGAVGVYAFGLFVVELCAEFNWTRAQVYLAHTITTMVTAVCGPFVGRWVDRHGIQPLMTLGALIGGVFFALLGLTHFIWYLYGIYFIMAIAQSTSGQVPVNTMITNWFEKKRGTVLGILATGVGWGGIIMTPLIAWIISVLSWRAAYAILGIARVLLIVPLVTFIFRFRPEEKGLLPDGREPEAEEETPSGPEVGESEKESRPRWTLKTAVKQPAFWFLFTTFFSLRFGLNVVMYHAIPFFTDAGITIATAATLMTCIAGCGIVGKLVGGYIADKIGPKPVAIFAYSLHAVAIFIAIVANTMPVYLLFTVLFGLSLGAAAPMMVMLTAQCFGRESFGAIFGTMAISFSMGLAIGPLVSGHLFDITGSYDIPFFIAIGFLIIACITVSLARSPKPKVSTPSSIL